MICIDCGDPIPLPTSDPFRCPACRLPRDNAREALKQGIALTQTVMDQILYGMPGPLPEKPKEAKA